jgi:GTPase SAR1 family protein
MDANTVIETINNLIKNPSEKSCFTYKIPFIGNNKSGKTKFLNSLIGETTQNQYIPTLGLEVHPYVPTQNMCFNIWDRAGDPKYKGFSSGYLLNSAFVIVFINNEQLNDVVCDGITKLVESNTKIIFAKIISNFENERVEKINDLPIVYTHTKNGPSSPLLLKKMIEIANEVRNE